MQNRNSKMGGSDKEKFSLIELEKIREYYMQKCTYQNEKNWVSSVTCMNRISLSKILFYKEIIDKIQNIPGSIIELGIQWEQQLTFFIILLLFKNLLISRRKSNWL